MKKLENFDRNFKEMVSNYVMVLLTALVTFIISAVVTESIALIIIATYVAIVAIALLMIACEVKEFAMKKLTELLQEETE